MSFSKILLLTAIAATGLLMSSCGLNPFGPSESGYQIFAYIGKAVAKPSQINDQQGSKQDSKATVARAEGMAKRLAKTAVDGARPAWLDTSGITSLGNDTYVYFEEVTNKPSDEDADKLVTGRGEVKFGYAAGSTPTLSTIDTAKITSLISFGMLGHEYKPWNSETDSVHLAIEFLNPDVKDFKPGKILAWARNISTLQSSGAGDTAAFTLDSLDDVKHIQYGAGHFLDAHTGRLHEGEPYSFNFAMEILFKNTQDASKPYQRYQDNEGIVRFFLPRPVQKDSLYFVIHFYPQHERDGTIQKEGPGGQVMVRFQYNDKTRIGTATYYNDQGHEIGNENL